jgi:hypothetical protein
LGFLAVTRSFSVQAREWRRARAISVILRSELDDERYEVRKVEIFSDGRMGFASEREASVETMLVRRPGEQPD